MDNECSHGVKWDISCFDCEIVGLNETISHSSTTLANAKARKIAVQAMIDAQRKLVSDAYLYSMLP